ncbi:double-strand break repair helicase AddA [Aestuariibius insulae]|uniref:double-strand break repair helicase AddA n=1 Tax=Aestuariibius insulae TaxID=2058287 RepID=UPI00345E64A3
MSVVPPLDEATERQIRAADPRASTWLAANAGSGKTRVLTDRVARLLLDGVEPQRILCLTYTKAAASEMQNRLFRRLGEWAMLPRPALEASLRQLGVTTRIDADRIAEARRLFARAIETPGGLKIQTIHSFCAALLRRFPLEAGVSPGFVEMDERSARQLRLTVLERLAEDAPEVVGALMMQVTGGDIDDLMQQIVSKAELFEDGDVDAALRGALGLSGTATLQDLIDEVVGAEDLAELGALRDLCRSGKSTDQKAADKLDPLIGKTRLEAADLAVLEEVFLTGASAKAPFSAKIGTFPTKDLRETAPDLMGWLNPLMERVEAGREARLALMAFDRSRALHRFARDFLPTFAAAKERRGWLDFDDLIRKARQLLTARDVAQWVLFRLDGGIDHILVDEAQDTSPAQWDVIRSLAQEFTAGEGARVDAERTIFVVGDLKQSIYSFQGADPGAFDRMRAHFEGGLNDAGRRLKISSLDHSFRSAVPILRLVDEVFRGTPGLGTDVLHKAFKADLPGRVDLWPPVPVSEKDDKPDWTDPIDYIPPGDPKVQLARTVAAEIERMIAHETLPEMRNDEVVRRPVTAGDILILVRGRTGALFSELIQSCKARGIDVAGADRLRVIEDLAVKDILAVLAFLALPEDDYALACALKSPLFGWSEGQLYDLAQPRPAGSPLWAALRAARADHPETMAILDDLRNEADFRRPYDLIDRLLTRHGGRARLLSRLGREAEDAIDALLSLALTYEAMDVPSLTGFLGWLDGDEIEIKREMGAQAGKLRVMTVHGAKGLEAPIVILPDMAVRKAPSDPVLFDADGTALWGIRKADRPAAMNSLSDAAKAKQEEERNRLLYVAMTRAESWLICCAAGEVEAKDPSWYARLAAAMPAAGAVEAAMPTGEGLRLSHADWMAGPLEPQPAARAEGTRLPGFATCPAPTAPVAELTLSPSDLGGAKALPGALGETEEEALAHGKRVHTLLEILPDLDRGVWQNAARNHLTGKGTMAEIDRALAEAVSVLATPTLTYIFAPGALAEVSVTAPLAALGGRRIHGAIDRLIVEETRILAVDFKTNRTVPDRPEAVPDGLLRQMGAYAAALSLIFPERRIETAILWTATGALMPLAHDLVSEALRTATPA